MIIWGSTSKQKVLGSGHFACPGCRNDAPVSHLKLESYFTLYFIPLFPIRTLAEYVECGFCRGKFQPQVLHYALGQGGWGPPAQGGWGPPGQGGGPPPSYG